MGTTAWASALCAASFLRYKFERLVLDFVLEIGTQSFAPEHSSYKQGAYYIDELVSRACLLDLIQETFHK